MVDVQISLLDAKLAPFSLGLSRVKFGICGNQTILV
jgi:hypothetical protein